MKIPSLVEMLEAGVHFGHQMSRWHPKMKPFIFTERNGVHIIDLEKTSQKLEETLVAVTNMATEGKTILFITTKPQAREIVKEAAIDCGMPYLVERWLGGLLTNFDEIKKLIQKYVSLKEQQANGELERYTKKEQLRISKELEKMDGAIAGLVDLKKMPDVVFIPAVQREKTAVVEANKMDVPIVGVCDTNANPNKVDYVIPANDDAVNSIKMIVNLVAEAVKEGKKKMAQNDLEKKTVSASKSTVVVASE
ncbi:MAG: 30S ribosomal protein S2 [Candidatus Magasanikbacteria bacterium CG_4_10_14_0_2_um_filter_37_12]|uniref:Small ribosomal subunit protein uS2 n=1 Tax=Candidatus Magasanikbacteria bacterium CG_4_10_14_0_2_um_filter_37_12 TaxID=1974637 RepID=A0A2M7V9M7_9BACT|nr:MAG: 30S ribosomal protein S2 [Candidatus Magasanikbacteria bacterium CG_4_10_14_0_2_um_filter_37_12]